MRDDAEIPLPGAVVVGPMKAGTTWLHNYLEQRGDICLPRGTKEIFYFDRHSDRSVAWYASHFRHYDQAVHRAIVEVSPSYFPNDQAAVRIGQRLHHPKIIIIVRDPIARAWSHYKHMRRYGYTRAEIKDAVAEYPEILQASRYAERIGFWRRQFGEDNLWIGSFETLKSEPERFCRGVCEFLQLPYLQPQKDMGRNEAAQPSNYLLARTTRTFARLLRRYRLYPVIQFAHILGLRDLVYGRGGKTPVRKISERERDYLHAQLKSDVASLGDYVEVEKYNWYSAFK